MNTIRLIVILLLVCSLGKVFSSEVKQEHKVVLITGASRGIGLATAETLGKKGYHVYGLVRKIASGKSLIHPNIHFEEVDLTNSVSIAKFVKKILHKEGRLDVLINNAGYALAGPVEHLSIDEIKEQMDINFIAMIRMCQEVLPQMRKQKGGRIINISSEQGTYGLPYGSLYTASKAAVESLSEALRIELLPWDIAVSIVEPGLVSTNFTIKMGSRKVENNPYQRVITIIGDSLKQQKDHLKDSEISQTPNEIAEFLLQVIEDPSPKLRYQTSEAAKEMVSVKIKDLSGEEYFKIMKDAWLKTYFSETK